MKKKFFGFSQNVFILSAVSFLNDVGGETIKRTIPLFLTNVLGVKTGIVGIIEGVGEATPQIFQLISGNLSDRLKKRKGLILFGQALRSLMVFLFWAGSWPIVLILRFLDRSGKGITGAPRDALISLSSEDGKKGRSFGLNRTMDNAGAVFGLLAAALIIHFAQKGQMTLEVATFQKIVLLAVIPLFLALIFIFLFVADKDEETVYNKLEFNKKLGKKFYKFLGLSFLFTLGNSSDGFLILRAQNLGTSLAIIFLFLAILNLSASVVSLPAGNLSDQLGRKKLLLGGWFLYALIYLGFGVASSFWSVFVLFLLYGFYYGATEGVAKALVADVVPKDRQGTAFGIYNMVVGLTLFPASVLAGYLWQYFSPAATFYFGALMSFLAFLGLVFFKE